MALTVTALGTGNTTTLATSCTITLATSVAVGDRIIVCISQDNGGAGGLISMQAPTDSKGHSYTALREQNYDPGTIRSGITGGLYSTIVSTAMSAGDTITLNSLASDAISGVAWKVAPGAGNKVALRYVGGTTGAATGAPTTTTPSLGSGEVVIGMVAAATNAAVTGDADTSNGTWSTHQTAQGNNSGTAASNVRISSQYKVVTGAGTQTYNPTYTSAGSLVQYITLREYTPGSGPLILPWQTLGYASDPLQTPPSDGASIGSWRDASGNGYNFSQGTGTRQPTYRAASADLNGKPAWDHDGTEGLQSATYPQVGPVTIVTVAYIDPTQPNALGWITSGYDVNVKLDSNGYINMHSWGSSSHVPVQTIDRRGQLVLIVAYFNGANSKWQVNADTGTVSQAGGNTFATRLTSAVWDGNVTSTETTRVKHGMLGTYAGDLFIHPDFNSFLGWVNSEYGINTGVSGGTPTPGGWGQLALVS